MFTALCSAPSRKQGDDEGEESFPGLWTAALSGVNPVWEGENMHDLSRRARNPISWSISAAYWLLLAGITAAAPTTGKTGVDNQNELWRKTVELVSQGDFTGAASLIRQVQTPGALTERVRGWLDQYEKQQEARLAANRDDLEKYVKYSKQRIDRGEYKEALGWLLAAQDVAEDRNALLASDWVHRLVNVSLEEAERFRQQDDWREAWNIYSQLAQLFEREPRYQKLEREAVTHLRLEAMFKKDSHWDERIEDVHWKDAKVALEYIEAYYVEPPDFKKITEGGLEQLLLLADSKSAQEKYPGLGNASDRSDFKARVREHLDQVRESPTISRRECIRRLGRVVETINEQTVRLPEDVLVSELMRGALEPLDEFTSMIWPQETDEFEKHTRGDFIGVGISIIKNRSEEIEVVTPLEDTPAYQAGVQQGDIITHVDGESLEGKSLNKVVDTITGPKDSMVNLTIRRGEQSLQFPLRRAKVKIQSVKGWNRNPDETWDFWRDKENGIAYVRLANFQRNTPEDLQNVMSELQAKGLKGMILDLRGNPGGLLDSAWQISSLFLKRGEMVVSTKGRIPDDDQELVATSGGTYSDVPLVVLVDESSASASEIVSGAVRDNGRGVVMGERTFGKFSVQNLIPLGPSRSKLKITTARYYLPSGVSLHREPDSETWGVEPQVKVPLCSKERVKAYQLRRDADLLGPAAKKADQAKVDELNILTDDVDDVTKKDDESKVPGPASVYDPVPWFIRDPSRDDHTRELATVSEEFGLPTINQPDENDRPKDDPQVDSALVYLQIKLLGERHPTLATAELDRPRPVVANP